MAAAPRSPFSVLSLAEFVEPLPNKIFGYATARRDSAAYTVTVLRAEPPKRHGSVSGRGRDFSLPPNALNDPPNLLSITYRRLFTVDKYGPAVRQTTCMCVNVKNDWSHTSTLPYFYVI